MKVLALVGLIAIAVGLSLSIRYLYLKLWKRW